MFRHQGKSRTLKHNIHLATVLSFVAGLVNVTGYLAFKQLTTNVTGHFALFMNDVSNFEFWKGTVYFLFIFSFLFGSFTSGFLIEKFNENKKLNVFALPTILESLVLVSIAISSNFTNLYYPNLIACLLLFAMGLQNSFVTKISNAVVRTTHLTGLFTDLGIELSQLFFIKAPLQRASIKATIRLRIYIICFFFFGGLVGGFFFSEMDFKLNTLLIGAAVSLISLFYDDIRFRLITTKRRFRKKQTQ